MRYIFLIAVLHPCRASRRPTQCSDIDRNSRALASRWMMNVTIPQYILAPPLTIRPNFRLQYPITNTNNSRSSNILTIIRRIINNNRPRIIIKVTFLRNRRPLRQRQSFRPRIIDRIHPMVWLSPCLWFMGHHRPSPTSLLP